MSIFMFSKAGKYVSIYLLLLLSGHAFAEDYTLAVNWKPEFCEYKPKNLTCQSLNSKQFSAQNLSLHGLWPQNKTYCTDNPLDEQKDRQSRWSKLPRVTLSRHTQSQLTEVMPEVVTHLERHEWVKHGSCSGVSQELYFKIATKLTRQLAFTELASLLRSKIGQETSLQTLQTIAQAEFGPLAKNGMEFLCSRKDRSQSLYEIRFHLNADSIDELNFEHFVMQPARLARKRDVCINGPVYIRPVRP